MEKSETNVAFQEIYSTRSSDRVEEFEVLILLLYEVEMRLAVDLEKVVSVVCLQVVVYFLTWGIRTVNSTEFGWIHSFNMSKPKNLFYEIPHTSPRDKLFLLQKTQQRSLRNFRTICSPEIFCLDS